MALKRAVKRLRAFGPLNAAATATVRALFRPFGGAPESVVSHLHRIGHVRSRLPNGRDLRLWSRADDWVSNRVYWRGWAGYEPETAPLFFRLAASAEVTIDVGAYVGFYTLLAAHANPGGRVIAFEPLPTAFERLRGNVARNALANVRCSPEAVSDHQGEAEFFFAPPTSENVVSIPGQTGIPCSSSLSYEFMKAAAGLQRAVVPTTTLDLLIPDNPGRVGLIKIDTESTEADVLRGAGSLLERDRPPIVCEVLPGRETGPALEEILRPLGYRFFHLTPEGPIERGDIAGHPDWLNYLFAVDAPGTIG